MRFKTRSIEEVVADLTRKLELLPEKHPDRPTLIRMLGQLAAEVKGDANKASRVPALPNF